MEEKVNNITINLTSLVDYIRDKDFEIENWRYKHLKELKENKKLQDELNKQKEVLDKIKEYIKKEKEEYEKAKENYKRIGIEDYKRGQLVVYKHIEKLLEEIE